MAAAAAAPASGASAAAHSAAAIDTGLDADAVEFCPQAGRSRWAVVGTYKLRERDKGGKAEQQTRDGELILVDVDAGGATSDGGGGAAEESTAAADEATAAAPAAAPPVRASVASRLPVPGVFDIKWSGPVGGQGASFLGHAAADGTLRVYTLGGVGEGGGDEAGSGRDLVGGGRVGDCDSAGSRKVAGASVTSGGESEGASAADGAPQLAQIAWHDCESAGGESDVGSRPGGPASALALSLGWNDTGLPTGVVPGGDASGGGGAAAGPPTAAVSMSDGSVCIVALTPTGLARVAKWAAHEAEAWIAAFDPHNANTLFTGADDMKFKRWDLRSPTDAGPAATNSRSHEAGVCTIQGSPHAEHCVVTGSYDEHVRVWDTRRLRSPVATARAGGGVWRVKWFPAPGANEGALLCAAMHGGFAVLRYDAARGAFDEGSAVRYSGGHTSLGYGADWMPGGTVVGTASFYDHRAEFWRLDEGCTRVL